MKLEPQVEDEYENAQSRKAKPMQPIWLYLFWSKFFEDTFEKTQWSQVEQMQGM